MAITDWTVPFLLRSRVYTNSPSPGGVSDNPLPINSIVTFPSGTGYYLLREDGCSLVNQVRSTKEFVPQADGSILHCRFVAGMEMTLAIQMWQDAHTLACDTLLKEMVDTLNGYLYGLLNAGDNDGRIDWLPSGNSSVGSSYRMLEDIRLLTYPAESHQTGSPYEVTVTLDTEWPYAVDETQLAPTFVGGSGTITNYGNRPTYPVWKIYGPYDGFVITNLTTGDTFSYDSLQPSAPNIGVNDYIEIGTFKNTSFKNGSGANCDPGIVMATSDFFTIPPGTNSISVVYTGAVNVPDPVNNDSTTALINAAWS